MSKGLKTVVGIAAVVGIGFATGGLGWVAAGTAQATALGGSGLAAFGSLTAGRLLTSVAFSALSGALMTQKASAGGSGGTRADQTLSGASTPANFILGRMLTTGTHVCPPMAHGKVKKTPNAYLTYVISLADAPGHTLDGLLINERFVEITDQVHGEYGNMIRIGSTSERAWVRYHNGYQTAADSYLVGRYGTASPRPWTADMVGNGVCYAVLTFRYDDQLFSGPPSVKFVMGGVPLYDPRRDSSVGGNGAHRWGDLSTYERSENPVVQSYNIRRGITLPGGKIWGGTATANQLPLSNWVAAMNACDAQVDRGDGVTEPAWRTSFEVLASDEPASVLEEIERAGSLASAERGGIWSIRVGGPGAPVAYISGDDVLASQPITSEMVRGFDDLYNGCQITYPDPDSGYVAMPAPLYLRDDLIARDADRQLVADLTCGAGPYPYQMQRLARGLVEDSRRGRVYVIALPPEFGYIEALDSISLTLEDDGFSNKIFEVRGRTVDPFTQIVTLSLRERDPGDWGVIGQLPHTPTPPVWPAVETLGVPDFAVAPWIIRDGAGDPRRPGILLTWDGVDLDAVTAIQWQYRVAGSTAIMSAQTPDVVAGQLVQEVSLANTDYEVRAAPVTQGIPAEWSGWLPVRSPDVTLTLLDLSEDFRDWLQAMEDWINSGAGDIVKTIADLSDRIASEEAARVADAELAAQRWQETGAALSGLGDQIGEQEAARVADAEIAAQRWRDLRDTVRQISAEVVELSSTGQAAMDEIRRSISVQLGDLRASYDEQIVVLATADKAMAARIETLEVSNGGMSADIVSLRQTVVEQGAALAQTADQLGTRIDDAETGVQAATDAVAGLSSRTEVVEGKTTTQGEDISALQSQVADPETGLVALAEGIDRLTTEIEQGDGGALALHSEAIRSLRNAIRAIAAEGSEAGARTAQEQAAAREYIASVSQSLSTRIDLTDDQVRIVAEAVTSLQTAIPGLATSDALQALRAVVEQQDDRISASSTALTQLASTLDALTGVVDGKASSEAVAGLTTRVTDAEGEIEAQGQSLTQLDSRVSGNEDEIAGVSGAVGGLSTRVTQAENGLTAQGEDISALQSQVSDPETGLDALAEGIDRLTTEAEQGEDGIAVQSAAIRLLRNTIRAIAAEQVESGARNEQTQNDLREYTSEASQSINSRIDLTDDQVRIVAEAVTALQAAIPGLATAKALQALQTVVEQQGDRITASSTALTQLSAALDALSGVVDGKASATAVSGLTTRVEQAEGKIAAQGSSLDQVSANLTALDGDVDAAQQAAQDAATLAGSKGKNIVQSAAPAVADRLAQNLWIDTTGGANTPKRWNGSAWVPVTDKVATDAAAAAANALALAGTKADASALTNLQATVTQQGNQIQSQATGLMEVNAAVDDVSASGKFKVEATATPSTSNVKIGLIADAGGGGGAAALYLQSEKDGRQLAVVDADTFLMTGGNDMVFPFAVVNGKVLINSAVIGDATITNAMIGDLTVDTLKIRGNAISEIFTASRSSISIGSNYWVTTCSVGLNAAAGDKYIVAAMAKINSSTFAGLTRSVIDFNGTGIFPSDFSLYRTPNDSEDIPTQNYAVVVSGLLNPGWNVFDLRAFASSGGGSASACQMTVLRVKK